MTDEEKSLESLTVQDDKTKAEKGRSKLLSPDPKRRKLITELLHAFANRKISFADLTRMDKKKIKQLAEMGYVKLHHGRYDEARKIFEVLAFLDYRNFFHHLALAGAYQKLNKHLDALFQYSETLKIDPKNINALVNRGEIYLRAKNYRKSAEDFREAILLDEMGKSPFANRARSLVIAIKRGMARDKELASQPKKPVLPKARKKTVSPLVMVKKSKK